MEKTTVALKASASFAASRSKAEGEMTPRGSVAD